MPKAIVQPITNFTTRDGLFLLAALIALLLSLREGQIQVNLIPLWRIPIQRDETRVRGKGDRQISHLPGPLVSDLDGGGLNDIIVVDSKCGLRLFRVINGVLSAEKVRKRDRLGLGLVEEMIIVSCSSHFIVEGVILNRVNT